MAQQRYRRTARRGARRSTDPTPAIDSKSGLQDGQDRDGGAETDSGLISRDR